jgi:hypothetical protein
MDKITHFIRSSIKARDSIANGCCAFSSKKKGKMAAPSVTPCEIQQSTPLSSPNQCNCVKDKALDPEKGALRDQLNHFGIFHCPVPTTKKSAQFALHHWFDRSWQVMGGVVLCCHCEVHLCIDCFDLFHSKRDLLGKKELLMEKWQKNEIKGKVYLLGPYYL